MELQEWSSLIKGTKRSTYCSGQIILRCSTNKTHTKQRIHYNQKATIFGEEHLFSKGISVEFKKEHHLTVFEAAMLIELYINKRLVEDYSKYHECIAGKRFIENIKSIVLDEKVDYVKFL